MFQSLPEPSPPAPAFLPPPDPEEQVLTATEAQRMVALYMRPQFPTMYVGEAVQMQEDPPVWEVFFRDSSGDHLAEVRGFTLEDVRLIEEN